MLRMLEMIPKRGPDAYKKFMECLEEDYPWIVRNFKEKETELLRQTRGKNLVDCFDSLIETYYLQNIITYAISIYLYL